MAATARGYRPAVRDPFLSPAATLGPRLLTRSAPEQDPDGETEPQRDRQEQWIHVPRLLSAVNAPADGRGQ